MPIEIHKTRIRQIVSRDVVTVTPDTPAAEAIAVMARARISCLVISERKRPVGIFTERDVVRTASRLDSFGELPIGELMTSPVFTIHGNMTIFEAYSLMVTNRIRHHVVVGHDGRLLGVMSQSDLVNLLGLEYFMEMRKIESVMTAGVVTVERDVPVEETIRRMAGPGISCIVVADEGRPAGIVTERDAARLVTAGIDLKSAPVEQVMSCPVLTVPAGTTVHTAALIMKREGVRRVVVTDEAGAIAGIVTQSNIVRGLEGRYIESLKEIIQEKEELFQQTARELLNKTIYLDNILNSSIDMAIIATDDTLRIKYFNPAAEEALYCRAANAIGRAVTELPALDAAARARLGAARTAVLKKGKQTYLETISHDGVLMFYDASLTGILEREGGLVGYVLMLRDITERKQYEETIHHLAYHDALTGLPNRVLLRDRLVQALAASQRTGGRGALMILDLDRFKDINDTLGHSMGDLLLKAASERLRRLLRKSDTVSRMGGDEFVLLLPTIATVESAAIIAGKIVRAFRRPFVCDGHTLKVTASIGVADFPDDGTDDETLMKNADIALYRVKAQGRNNFQRYVTVQDER